MNEEELTHLDSDLTRCVRSGEDLFHEQHGLQMSRIDLKVVSTGSQGLLVLENTFGAKGGPARHLHFDQDEWFYVLEGEFLFEVGRDRFCLRPGDSLLAPRNLPHVWAHVGNGQGRILVGFSPAGQMESFFRNHMSGNVPPPKDPEIWQMHGMELLGPPLELDNQ